MSKPSSSQLSCKLDLNTCVLGVIIPGELVLAVMFVLLHLPSSRLLKDSLMTLTVSLGVADFSSIWRWCWKKDKKKELMAGGGMPGALRGLQTGVSVVVGWPSSGGWGSCWSSGAGFWVGNSPFPVF